MFTQLMKSLTPRRLSVSEMTQAKTGIHNQLWRLYRDSIRKINDEMFK
jgi:hypothetical protein